MVITTPSVVMQSPNGEENLFVGSSFNITANISGAISSKSIEFSNNGGNSWNFV
jgi:hypothetical protein